MEVTGVTTLGNSSSSGITTTRGDLFVGGEFSAANNGTFGGTVLADNVGVANIVRGNVGIFTTGNIEVLNVSDQTNTLNLSVSGVATITEIDATLITVGVLTVTSTVEVGFATVTDLYVANSTNTGFLNVRETATFNDNATFSDNITANGSVISANSIVSGVTTTGNLLVTGIATASGINVIGVATVISISGSNADFYYY